MGSGVTEEPAVATFGILRRMKELLEHGEILLTTAGCILDEPLPVVRRLRNWGLSPCTMRNPLVARYCDEGVKELLTECICCDCYKQMNCTDKVTE